MDPNSKPPLLVLAQLVEELGNFAKAAMKGDRQQLNVSIIVMQGLLDSAVQS